ncbi:MAG: hypothetical protein Q9187_006092 [Circinaria calcarea]
MANKEGYMLQRDSQESKRLNAQHDYMVALSQGHLTHPSIPLQGLKTVADVAIGTGIWLKQLAASPAFARQPDGERTTFVGFDISPQQFLPTDELPSNVCFKVHDFLKPFPVEYHEKFDLVNVRLLSYVIRAVDLETVVQHILQILRPGGFLQWQECDAGDSWTKPETSMATATINYVISEKAARGLFQGIAAPLIKTIQSYSVEIPNGYLNPISFSSDLMRITQIQTVSTANHPSAEVAVIKKFGILQAAVVLLEASLSRRKSIVADPQTSDSEKEKEAKEIDSITQLIAVIKRGEDHALNIWDMELTWIVARKAIILDVKDAWMSVKYPA